MTTNNKTLDLFKREFIDEKLETFKEGIETVLESCLKGNCSGGTITDSILGITVTIKKRNEGSVEKNNSR